MSNEVTLAIPTASMVLRTGLAGTDGNMVRFGNGAPSSDLGSNGDYYFDKANGNLYYKASGTWTLDANQVLADAVAAAQAAEALAEDHKLAAQSAAANAITVSQAGRFATVAAFVADNNVQVGYAGSGAALIVSPGTRLEAEGIFYDVVASNAATYDLENAGGVRVTVPANAAGEKYLKAFAPAGDTTDGTDGTNDTAVIQKAIDSFGGARGVLLIDGSYRADSALIDFKRVALIGSSLAQSAAAVIYVGASGGLYTSVEDNAAPPIENLLIKSSSTKTANGQTLLNLSGLNYPRLNNVTLFGGETGLLIGKGVTVESHYGVFTNVNVNQCYYGYHVEDGLFAQSHSFVGGRAWDCVYGYRNAGTGAADINFFGTVFESDNAFLHDATATAADTKLFGCRNESDAVGSVEVGIFSQFGTYWSGTRRAEPVEEDAGALVEFAANLKNVGVNNAADPVAPNVLPNPLFEFDPSSAATDSDIIAGWTPFSATHYSSGKATEGNYIRLERQSTAASIGVTSRSIRLPKGRYVFSCGFVKNSAYGAQGIVTIDFLRSGSSFGAGGTYADLSFPYTYTNLSEYAVAVEILQDIEQFQFRISCGSSSTGRYFYVFNPQLLAGRRGANSFPMRPQPAQVLYGDAVPTGGYFSAGDRVINLNPAAGEPSSWVCVSAGTPGTWWVEGQVGYRTSAGDPTGSVTPYFVGENFLRTGVGWYKSTGLTSADWQAL